MSSQHIILLRRPLPPKKLPPIKPPLSQSISGSASGQESDYPERSCPSSSAVASWEGSADPQPTAIPQPTPVTPSDPPPSPSPPAPPRIFPHFHCRPARILPTIPLLSLLPEHARYAPLPPPFLLNDFLLQLGRGQSHGGSRRRRVSVYHYRKLVEHFLFDLHSSGQTEVANQILSSEQIPPTKRRVPQRQMLCELEALIRMEYQVQSLRSVCECDTRSQSKQPTAEEWTPQDTHNNDVTCYPGSEVILNSASTKHFQGVRRSSSPFEPAGGWGGVSASQLAILDCLHQRANTLSLKAHFITQLPDLSVLADTLVYLNLSFNNLSEFPLELCSLRCLQQLKMRDNPLQLLPPQIRTLTSLRTLVLSFCRLLQLPNELYSLPCLQHLDVSYNLLTFLSSSIRNLRSLRSLNVEGNQLLGLPAGVLRLSLDQLRLSLNYTHPALWNTHSSTHTHTHTVVEHTSQPAAAGTHCCTRTHTPQPTHTTNTGTATSQQRVCV
ncbi:uncharacterized protein LOC125292566 [Alosa alosa]|uniref:uncharacterized protein LOC125292566 n=1 Tax=Alosa alosa TaxID=278164 RepID=UPI002015107D|nr:uncharacterized protein LOC125292566 [Alosa alosa]